MAPLILLHGLAECPESWDWVKEFLPKDMPSEALAINDLVETSDPSDHAMAVTAKRLGEWLQKAYPAGVVIAGHSMGGYIALEVAVQFPSLILGLALVNSSPLKDAQEAIERRVAAIESIKANGKEAFLRGLSPKLFGAWSTPEVLEKWNSITVKTTDQEIISQQRLIMSRVDRVTVVNKLEYKALVIVSDEDTITPPAGYLSLLSSETEIELLANTAHHGPLQSPAQIVSILTRFYKRVTN